MASERILRGPDPQSVRGKTGIASHFKLSCSSQHQCRTRFLVASAVERRITTYNHPRVCLGHVRFACLGLNEGFHLAKGWGGLGLAEARRGVASQVYLRVCLSHAHAV
jgi:hypothetical protein